MSRAFYRWLIARVGARRLMMWLLLVIALSSVALGLAEATRGLGQGWLLAVAWLGVSVGWWLGRRSGSVALGLAALVGGAVTLGWIGRLDRTLVTLLSRSWRVPWADHPLRAAWQDVATLIGRVEVWLRALASGEPAYEPVAVALVWSVALWGVATWAGWAGRRERPLHAILPAAALLLLTLFYTGGQLYALIPLLATSFFLLVVVGHAIREREWEARGVDYSLELRTDHFFAAVGLALGLTCLAALAPSLSVGGVVRVARALLNTSPVGVDVQPFADSLGLERPAPPSTPFDAIRAPGLPRDHLIGAGPELGERLVMTIQLPETAQERGTLRWRGATYDRYSGRGWSTSATIVAGYEGGEWVAEPSSTMAADGYRFKMNRSTGGLLYAPGTLVGLDQPYRVAWRSGADFFSGYTEATTYEVSSVEPVLSAQALRGAGNVYPRSVARRYLSVPERVPERVLALARELTATEPTPYDRARAIERYLRTFPYTTDLPAPPPGREITDYFLFDLRQGYCDYYATAMVVLARAAGIPARLAVGYAAGEYDEAAQQYRVTEAEGHAWPELYFPGYGWVPFEPTASQPLGERAAELPNEVFEPVSPSVAERLATLTRAAPWGQVALGAGLLTLLVGTVASLWDHWRLRRLPPEETLGRLYGRFQWLGQRLGGVGQAGATPYEFSEAVVRRVREVQERQTGARAWWHPSLATIPEEIRRFTALYVGSAYAPHPTTPAQRSDALALWRRLRWRLWWMWLLAGVRWPGGANVGT